MSALKKFYLRKNIDDERTQEIVSYVKEFGHGNVMVEHIRGEVVLYVYNRLDVALIKDQFGAIIDGEATLK
jgi:hypothetical protein